ncbi:flagellar hook-basal body complex protein FliE [Clostridium senegalense]|uniref:flagellar hook-basal body complex protein FliE n=1 Tax=Clostridium senegalense TaxID=1465809 RepID=UPI001C128CC3|nr:flagellar hook-basal body complex protein FliE [Clostridium senegalense]MBU5225387.1 flagellar hook-basal body complex protein FliE [Clostridium senegalense]
MVTNEFVPGVKVFNEGIKGNIENKNEQNNVGSSFSEMLNSALNKVNETQVKAEEETNGFIKGDVNLHEAMVSAEEARLTLELAVQVRNKLINAYEEFNKMQI